MNQQQTITIGNATFELTRVFQGPQSLPELLEARLAQAAPVFDKETASAL